MAYSKQTWTNDVSKLNATRLNYIESGIEAAALVGDAAIPSPASIASGEAAIWNGSAWVRSSVTKLGYSSLSLTGSILNADLAGSIAFSKLDVNYGTSLPGSPVDKQVAILVDSTTSPTYQWMFRYNSGSSNTDKWEFVGGADAYNAVGDGNTTESTVESTSSTSYVALSTAGPSFALPRAGVYDITLEAAIESPASVSNESFMSYDIGGTGAVDADALRQWQADSNTPRNYPNATRTKRKTGLTAVTLTCKYRSSTGAAGANFGRRVLRVRPVRVS